MSNEKVRICTAAYYMKNRVDILEKLEKDSNKKQLKSKEQDKGLDR